MFHIPVMVREVIDYLYTGDGVYLDCTAGGGGHLKSILNRLKKGRIVAVDRDGEAVAYLKKKFDDARIEIRQSNFTDIGQLSDNLSIDEYDGVLFDLGVSLHQLKSPDRGFSFSDEGKLDMRMNQQEGITVRELILKSSEKEIYEIIKEYGQDPMAKKIAKAIYKNKRSLDTTFKLKKLIEKHIYRRYQKKTFHRVFQAFRIAVNRELDSLKTGIAAGHQLLSSGGRMVCISYHSLEDGIVKRSFRSWKDFTVLTKKPVRPSEAEVKTNPAARSARLRAGEKR